MAYRVFAPARLDLMIEDRFGNPVKDEAMTFGEIDASFFATIYGGSDAAPTP